MHSKIFNFKLNNIFILKGLSEKTGHFINSDAIKFGTIYQINVDNFNHKYLDNFITNFWTIIS